LAQVIADPELRNIVVPGMSDRGLARVLLSLAQPPSELWSAAPWVGYETPELTAFVALHTSEQ
jgi:hypothetical protein